MIEWNKYIKWGKFTSTHGVELPFKWEFNKLEIQKRDRGIILACVLSASFPHDLVVIDTVHPRKLKKYAKMVYYPQTNVADKRRLFKLKRDIREYVIYDDVVTTGKSMLKCIEKIGYLPEHCICLMDRRFEALKSILDKGWNLKVFTIEEMLRNE